MRVIRNRPDRNGGRGLPGRSAVTVGNFDGVHLGHQALIERCRELSSASDMVAVVTFEPLPHAFFNPPEAPARLSTVRRKLQLLQLHGVDLAWVLRFDRRLAALGAREFVEQVLVSRLSARAVVVGEDFRFGKGREGDVALLGSLGGEFDFRVHTVGAVSHGGERISSSGIRTRLAAGEFEAAARFLGRPFRMEGHVLRGAGLGRKLGYPTANLAVRARPSPVGGVLAAYARTERGSWLPAVANLGSRPAVGGGEPLLEVHFFDFDRDLYGQRLEVQFVAKLRDELDFGNFDALIEQMKQDEGQARQVLATAEPPAD